MPQLPLRLRNDRHEFQSHLGSILPRLWLLHISHDDTFQSHLGSILPVDLGTGRGGKMVVSIPPWFDFARCYACCEREDISVSIPPWFDFAALVKWYIFKVKQVSIPPWFDFAASALSGAIAGGAFQSHLGSILPLSRYQASLDVLSFNPTLVRFCPIRAALCGVCSKFQSHLGSILPQL